MLAPPDERAMSAAPAVPPWAEGSVCADCFCRAFSADPMSVREALRAAVARYARRITAEDAGALELALGEVLNNIVEHAYAGRPAGRIHLVLRLAGKSLACQVEDQGAPMPGLVLPGPSLPATRIAVADLAEGGWGWALIHGLTEDLRYVRREGRNRLSFRLPLGPQ